MAGAPRVMSLARSVPQRAKPSRIPIRDAAAHIGSTSSDQVETWIPSTTKRVYAIMDNLSSHRTTDVLLFLLGASTLGDGVPAQVCGLSQPDRALVEDPALAGVSGPAV